MSFIEKNIDDCVRVFHKFGRIMKYLMGLNVVDVYQNGDKQGRLFAEYELLKYYKKQNALAITMLETINEVNKLY